MTRVLPASKRCPVTLELTSRLSVAWETRGSLCTMSYVPWPEGLAAVPTGLRGGLFSDRPQAIRAHLVLGQGCQPVGGPGAGPGLEAAGMHGACFVVSEEKLLSDSMLVEAREASDEDLLVVHTRRYLNELKVQGLGAASQKEGLEEGAA